MDDLDRPKPPRLRAAHLALLLAPLIYLVALGRLPLQLPDEPREAAIALEMWHNGPISVPRVNGEFHAVKPPVMYWTASAFLAASGSEIPGELSLRLAPALFSVGSIALLLAFGSLWFSWRHGVLAACALALSPEMISHGRRFMTDPALAFFVTACVGSALTALHRDAKRWPFVLASGLALGLGFLSKGPVAVILSGLAIAGAVAASRGVRGFWARPVLELYASYVLFLGPAVAYWVWLLKHEGGQDLLDFWVHYHTGGAKGEEGTPHLKPWWFYISTRGSDGVMPWVFFLPLLAWRKLDSKNERAPLLREIGLWCVLPLLFLSALAQKRDLYTLPLLPPVAVLASVAILEAPLAGTIATIAKVAWALVGVAFALGAVGGAGYGLSLAAGDHDVWGMILGGALLAASGAVCLVGWRDPSEHAAPLRFPFATTALGAILAISLVGLLEPRTKRTENTLRPTFRALIESARQEPGTTLHGYKLGDGTAVVNGALTLELGGRFDDVTTPEQLRSVLKDPHARVVLRKAQYDELGRPGRVVTEAHAVKRDGRHEEGWKHEYVLVAGSSS